MCAHSAIADNARTVGEVNRHSVPVATGTSLFGRCFCFALSLELHTNKRMQLERTNLGKRDPGYDYGYASNPSAVVVCEEFVCS